MGEFVSVEVEEPRLSIPTLAPFCKSHCTLAPFCKSCKRLFYDENVVCFQWWQYILISFVRAFFIPFVFVLFWGGFKLYSRNVSSGKFLIACCFPLPSLLFWSFVFMICRQRNAGNEGSSALSIPENETDPKVREQAFQWRGFFMTLSSA